MRDAAADLEFETPRGCATRSSACERPSSPSPTTPSPARPTSTTKPAATAAPRIRRRRQLRATCRNHAPAQRGSPRSMRWARIIWAAARGGRWARRRRGGARRDGVARGVQGWEEGVGMMLRPTPFPPGPGQESVWDFPRPAIVKPSTRHVVVRFGGMVIADTRRAWRALETSHPPRLVPAALRISAWSSSCRCPESAACASGRAPPSSRLVVPPHGAHPGGVARKAAWAYPRPTPAFAPIAGHIALYPRMMDECAIDGERVRPQEGGFYGGWRSPMT